MTTYSDDRGSHADRLSRLDQLEREIAEERERLSRADTATDRTTDRPTDQTTDRTTDQYADRTTDRPTDQYADRNAVPAVDPSSFAIMHLPFWSARSVFMQHLCPGVSA